MMSPTRQSLRTASRIALHGYGAAMSNTWTDHERAAVPLFDEAMKLRDEGKLEDAALLLQKMLRQIAPEQRGGLAAHAYVQLGYVRGLQQRAVDSERALREATRLKPRFELASIALFHALCDLERRRDALEEGLRLVSLRESLAYRELFEEGFDEDL